MSECELLLEDIFWVFEKESRREMMMGVADYDRGEVAEADSLLEKICKKIFALFCGTDGFFKRKFGESWVGYKGD